MKGDCARHISGHAAIEIYFLSQLEQANGLGEVGWRVLMSEFTRDVQVLQLGSNGRASCMP